MKVSWLRIPRRLKALRQLRSVRQWWLFGRVVVFAALVPALFRLKLATVTRLLERRINRRVKVSDSIEIETIIQSVELVMAIASPLVRPNCLTRSITLYHFLRPTGLKLSVCFGATLKNGNLEPVPGHCWLVKDGVPFLERNDPSGRFVPIYELPNSFRTSANTAAGSC
jgi:hypothetical protein